MLSTIGLNADALLSFFEGDVELEHLGAWTSLGEIELTGLKPLVPVFLKFDGTGGETNCYIQYTIGTGSTYTSMGGLTTLGRTSGAVYGTLDMIVPTESTLVINLSAAKGNFKLHAFTGK